MKVKKMGGGGAFLFVWLCLLWSVRTQIPPIWSYMVDDAITCGGMGDLVSV